MAHKRPKQKNLTSCQELENLDHFKLSLGRDQAIDVLHVHVMSHVHMTWNACHVLGL